MKKTSGKVGKSGQRRHRIIVGIWGEDEETEKVGHMFALKLREKKKTNKEEDTWK